MTQTRLDGVPLDLVNAVGSTSSNLKKHHEVIHLAICISVSKGGKLNSMLSVLGVAIGKGEGTYPCCLLAPSRLD
jgi:hypothetical protein